MATNFKLLNEQIRRLYARGLSRENVSPILDEREVKLYIVQTINGLIKVEVSNIGEVPDTVVGTYSVAVEESGCYFKSELPTMPINLPKNIGVFRVYPDGCPWKPFIPIKGGDFDIVQGTPAETLEGQIGYYQDGKNIIYTKNPGTPVIMKLIVNDPATISDTDILPIPAEMEELVVTAVLSKLTEGNKAQFERNSTGATQRDLSE